MSDVKLLCAADLHLGRRPGRLPASVSDISAASAWLELVERAVSEGVDAVLLAGDVVDQDNRYFEAYGPLEAGVRRLKEAGIALVAVAGNHDHATLHDVAAEVGQEHLVVLGRGGEWRRHTLRDRAGGPLLHVDGWSFPEARWGDDPLAGYVFEPAADGVPVVGLLHCDLDGREARYAPVSSAALEAAGPAAWVLGHVHAPELRDAGAVPLLYPGSLLALDPGERGRHGAWLLEIGPGSPPRFRPLALSPVRYEMVTVDVTGAADDSALRVRVVDALRSRMDAVVEEGCGPLRFLSCRVRLTGRTALHARLASALGRLDDLELPEREGVRLLVEPRLDDATAPALDLHDLARGNDAPALLARLLLAVEDGEADPALLGEVTDLAAAATGRVLARPHYAPVRGKDGVGRPGADAVGPPDAEANEATDALRRQASRLLDELVRRKEVA